MMSEGSNFLWMSTWRLPPSPIRRRRPEPDPSRPLCGRHKWMAPNCTFCFAVSYELWWPMAKMV